MRTAVDRHLQFAFMLLAMAFVATTATAGTTTAKWTEFGATKKAWYSAHALDPNMPPYRGCCFLPRQRDGVDRYNGVTNRAIGGVPRVVQFEMWFAPPISLAAARNIVLQEAPPGSKLVSFTRLSDCVLMAFKSSALTRAFKSGSLKASQPIMDVELQSSANGGPFKASAVRDILFLTLPVVIKGEC